MTFYIELAPLVSLVAGIAVLVFPSLLRFIVGAYLIVMGILGLTGHGF